jgi:hypothetical protein
MPTETSAMKAESVVRKAISTHRRRPWGSRRAWSQTSGAVTSTTTNPRLEEEAQDQRPRSVDDGVPPERDADPSVGCAPCESSIGSESAPQAGSGAVGSIAGRGNRRGRSTDRRSRKPVGWSPSAASTQLRLGIGVQRYPPWTPVVVWVGGHFGGQPRDAEFLASSTAELIPGRLG